MVTLTTILKLFYQWIFLCTWKIYINECRERAKFVLYVLVLPDNGILWETVPYLIVKTGYRRWRWSKTYQLFPYQLCCNIINQWSFTNDFLSMIFQYTVPTIFNLLPMIFVSMISQHNIPMISGLVSTIFLTMIFQYNLSMILELLPMICLPTIFKCNLPMISDPVPTISLPTIL